MARRQQEHSQGSSKSSDSGDPETSTNMATLNDLQQQLTQLATRLDQLAVQIPHSPHLLQHNPVPQPHPLCNPYKLAHPWVIVSVPLFLLFMEARGKIFCPGCSDLSRWRIPVV